MFGGWEIICGGHVEMTHGFFWRTTQCDFFDRLYYKHVRNSGFAVVVYRAKSHCLYVFHPTNTYMQIYGKTTQRIGEL